MSVLATEIWGHSNTLLYIFIVRVFGFTDIYQKGTVYGRRRMNRIIATFAVLVLMASALSGCGLLYNNVKMPVPTLSMDTSAQSRAHVGKASCSSYLWLVNVGDCSVQAAMDNGGITKIHHVDSEYVSYLLGLYWKFTTVAYGE
jgi:TRL-like protein family